MENISHFWAVQQSKVARFMCSSGTFSIAILTIVWLTGCKKYEDDPFISLRSPFHRMEGRKEITEFTIDGRDTMSFLTNRYGDFYINFTLKSTGYQSFWLYIFDKKTNTKIIGGDWLYVSYRDKEKDYITMSFENFYARSFFIKRLTKNEVHLEISTRRFNGANNNSFDFEENHLIKMKLREYQIK